MDAMILDALLSAVSGMIVKAIPAWVAAHPMLALAFATAYMLLEHLWPVLAAKGWVRGNSTLSVLFSTAKALLSKPPKVP